jgi:L-rhamnose mutarotase
MPKTREWWAIMGPMQKPLEARKSGEWWAEMEEVFHLE